MASYIAGYFSRTQNTQNMQKRIASLPLVRIADNISFPQTAQKTQNYARAALVLAYIAGYFSSTQNPQNTQKRIASLPLALIADNISFPQTAQKAQNYARASLVLASGMEL